MTIDGANITTYGLTLLSATNYLNRPARKKILKEPEFLAADIKLEPKYINVVLYGHYADEAAMESNLSNFKDFLGTEVIHSIAIPEYNISEFGVFADGANVINIRENARVELKITVTDELGT